MKLAPYYASVIDTDSPYIEILIGKRALIFCETHYKYNGSRNVIGLLDEINPNDYEFPVFRKIVSIHNLGTSTQCIHELVTKLIEQGALKVFAAINDDLFIRDGMEAQNDIRS